MSEALLNRRQVLAAYLQTCVDAEDWHGALDCCVDLEVLDARIAIYKEQRPRECEHQWVDALVSENELGKQCVKCSLRLSTKI